MTSHLSVRTRSVYDVGIQRYYQFCQAARLDPLCATPVQIVNFLGSLYEESISLSTAKVYLAAVNNLFVECGLDSPTASTAVTNAVKGYSRLNPKQPDRRLPVTYEIMRHIRMNIPTTSGNVHDQRVHWCAFTFAFFGFLRVSEVAAPSSCGAVPLRGIDVELGRDTVTLSIRRSKTDQTGEGQAVVLHASKRSVCPVAACSALQDSLRALGFWSRNDSFFTMKDGSVLTVSRFRESFKIALAGVAERHRFGTHSFRIGAATEAAMAGTHPDDIKLAGRWKSGAYQGYIRRPNVSGLRL